MKYQTEISYRDSRSLTISDLFGKTGIIYINMRVTIIYYLPPELLSMSLKVERRLGYVVPKSRVKTNCVCFYKL